jgi:hypothetical protein
MKDAKGHGSDAHQAGVNQVGQAVHPKVLDAIRSNPNGFSVTPQGETPKGGYMVAVPGRTQIVNAEDLAGPHGPHIVGSFVAQHAGVLATPGAHIGGWTDKETGLTHLDISHNIPTRPAAIQAGRERNQIAIYDVKRNKEIRTGGTGG